MRPDGPDNHPLMAVLYDLENPWGEADDFFLAVVERRSTSRVVDLGCGTGTVTTAFARGSLGGRGRPEPGGLSKSLGWSDAVAEVGYGEGRSSSRSTE